MIPNCAPPLLTQTRGIAAPPGLSQVEPQDTWETARPGTPDFLRLFQEAVARQAREKAREHEIAGQIQAMLQNSGGR